MQADGVLDEDSSDQWDALSSGAVIMDFGGKQPAGSRRCVAILLKKVGQKMFLGDSVSTSYAKKVIQSLQKRATK